MTSLRTQAIVLRRTNYGEADRILQLLTPTGKKGVIARGVRREKSKLAGGIELFAVCDIVIHQGKGELGTLASARLVTFYRHILEDYDTLQFAYEATKQIARASEMVDEPEWYDVLSEVLESLNVLSIPRSLIETWFYLRYANLMGHELSLTHSVDGRRLEQGLRYNYDVAEKGLREASRGEVTADHIKLMRLVSAKSMQVLVQVGGTAATLPVCWSVARQHAAL